ncbi:MAG: glycerol-3-phosphate dehydrogenase/oxidase [Acidobacteriota bacterium]
MMFPPGLRTRALAALDQSFDLVVLGGGISGCGIFFDASQRGLRVLLVEKEDVAAGTSSRSSKLIHGGLRYLKQMQFKVTRSSCRERDRHLAIDPHLVEPVDFVYPAFRGDKTPGWQVEIGLFLYDRMTKTPDKHRRVSEAELARWVPGLDRKRLDRAMVYRDARVDDARLTAAVAAHGVAYGGSLLTRARAEEALRDASGRVIGVAVRDLETDAVHRVRASLVINAAGAWVDEVRKLFGLDGRRVRPSRGSHLMFRPGRLAVDTAITLPSPDDGRPVFFVPHPEGLLVGTTDLFHHGPLDDPRPTRAEVDYLLRACAEVSGSPPPTLDDVAGAFAGLRPVIDQGDDDPTAASREEELWEEDGLLSIAGGKLTTWRLSAELVVDRAQRLIRESGASGASLRRSSATAGTPLAGLAPTDLDRRLLTRFDLEPQVASAMARRLLAGAWRACEGAAAEDLQPLRDDVDLCAAELRAHLRFGAVEHLSDLLLRRTRLGTWDAEATRDLAPSLREPVCAEMGWDGARWEAELERFDRDLDAWSPRGVAAV